MVMSRLVEANRGVPVTRMRAEIRHGGDSTPFCPVSANLDSPGNR